MAKKKEKSPVLTYKGTPLVQSGNTIIYGNIKDRYYIRFTVLDYRKVKDLDVAGNILVELMTGSGRMVKKAEREGLYRAMDIAEFWLADALEA
ncbi:MAG: hypothetical protein E7409_05815 [Ruminococcaceae bacterium]|nr:hypothetical protein [Oscillospiraceae bacterium]